MTEFERNSVYHQIKEKTDSLLSSIGQREEETEEEAALRRAPVRKAKKVFAVSNVPKADRVKPRASTVVGMFFMTLALVMQGVFR
ncbi:MAG: hypothetical protein J6Y62_00905 [Clostridia bacterium]|nr:hypothetical protein [Clostridia bacterium]